MPDYKQLYYIMFNAATDALESMEKRDFAEAKNILENAQQKAEDVYIDSSEKSDEIIDLKIIK